MKNKTQETRDQIPSERTLIIVEAAGERLFAALDFIDNMTSEELSCMAQYLEKMALLDKDLDDALEVSPDDKELALALARYERSLLGAKAAS